MNKYKILIFDLDDTLINNTENIRFAYKKMIESKNIKYSNSNFNKWYNIDKQFWLDWQNGLVKIPEIFKNETGKKSEDFLNWLRAQRVLIYFNNTISLKEAINLNNIYMQSLTNVVIPIINVYETLKYLSKKYYIIVATNGPSIAAEKKLEKINCLNLVKKILAADMFGYMKPKKEFFEAIQNILNNYNKSEYLIIGDSLKSDVGFGMNCGFDSCWFNKNTEKLTKEYKPTIIIENLIELKNIL